MGYSWDNGQLKLCQTVAFTTMVLTELLHSFNWRNETRSFLEDPPWRNRYLVVAFFISLGLQMAVLYVPFMQKAFHTQAPGAQAWALILACAIIPVVIIDRLKVVMARLAWRGKSA